MSLSELARLSREYGSDPEWVLAGGGNTSFKDDTTLYIKASGFALATITVEGFARMDRSRLRAIAQATYPSDGAARERRAAADLLAARQPGEEKRPSVETVMHELLPQRYVIHTHPAIVNGLTCAAGGESAANELLGDLMWIPEIEAGYVLAAKIGVMSQEYIAAHGAPPELVLIQNHGLVVGANTLEEVNNRHKAIRDTLLAAGVLTPDFAPVSFDDGAKVTWQAAIAEALGATSTICFEANATIGRFVANRMSFTPLLGAFTPDHVVYSGPAPLFVSGSPGELSGSVAAYRDAFGVAPRMIAVEGLGVFSCGASEKIAQAAMTLFLDSVKVAVFTESFGGYRHMSDAMVHFIQNWEVEQYRSKISVGESLTGSGEGLGEDSGE